MIKKLIEKLNAKKRENHLAKPRYKVEDLYVAKIVKLVERKHVDFGKVDHFYRIVKQFSILTKHSNDEYLHIKSNQRLTDMFWAIEGDYAITEIMPFDNVFAVGLRQANLDKKSKLSINAIIELENGVNQEHYAHIMGVDLFN